MSKIVMSLPEGMAKGTFVGVVASLISYVLLQFFVAFLICEEMLSEVVIHPAVCVSAGISAFIGCWLGGTRVKKGGEVSAATVVAVFLALTIMVGFFCGELGVNGGGLVRVGVSMSAGGLVAAVFCGARRRRGGGRYEKGKRRREKRLVK